MKYYPALIVWGEGVAISWFLLSFLGNFYHTSIEVLLLTFLVQVCLGLVLFLVLEKVKQYSFSQPLNFWLIFALVFGLLFFVWKIIETFSQYPHIFNAGYFFLKHDQIMPFLFSSALSLLVIILGRGYANLLRHSKLSLFLENYGLGLLLGCIFFVIYFPMSATFNQPLFDVDDIFFDTDGLLWRTRFTTDVVRDYYWRSVHPFVLLLIRPLIAGISIFLKGDRLAAAILLTAIAGGLCVFLAWVFLKQKTGNSVYAALIAALLGASAAHLVFSSLLETYIFLAVLALAFMVFMLKDRSFFVLVVTGLASFGITLVNFIQMAIGFIFIKRNFTEWVKYGFVVGVLGVLLTLLNNVVYPDSQPYFFIPSSLNAEADNTYAPSMGRANAVARVMILHSVVAPDPLILEEEIPFLKVWIFKAEPMRLSEYETRFGTVLALIWLGLCMLGGFLFLKNFKNQDNRFSLAFILILVFNFFLHLQYGKDLFLYSTNWTYALILFLAIQWKDLADSRWFQIVLTIFIFLLLLNNFRLIQTMLTTSYLHIR